MTLWSRVSSWLRATARRSRMESDMDAELRFHMEAYAGDLVRGGVPREEALRRARLEFGGIENARKSAAKRAACTSRKVCCRICVTGCARCDARRDSR